MKRVIGSPGDSRLQRPRVNGYPMTIRHHGIKGNWSGLYEISGGLGRVELIVWFGSCAPRALILFIQLTHMTNGKCIALSLSIFQDFENSQHKN
jgi:hypothetical protein